MGTSLTLASDVQKDRDSSFRWNDTTINRLILLMIKKWHVELFSSLEHERIQLNVDSICHNRAFKSANDEVPHDWDNFLTYVGNVYGQLFVKKLQDEKLSGIIRDGDFKKARDLLKVMAEQDEHVVVSI